MRPVTSFVVRGDNPYKSFQNLVIGQRLLRTYLGLSDCLVATHKLTGNKSLLLVDRAKFLDLQERQKVSEIIPELPKSVPLKRADLRLLLAVKPFKPIMAEPEVEEHQQNVAAIQEILKKLTVQFQTQPADQINADLLSAFNLVLVAGGDGTFLKVAKLLPDKGPPIFGVNSAPSTSFAHYLNLRSENLEPAFGQLFSGQFGLVSLPRIVASLTDEKGEIQKLPLPLNEIFVKDNAPAKATRCFLSLFGRKEFLYSDGLLVSTGNASGLNSWMKNAGGIFMPDGVPVLQVLSFNPNVEDRRGTPNLFTHFVVEGDFEIESANRYEPFVAVDGEKAASFRAGSRVFVSGVNSPLKFIKFGEAEASSAAPAVFSFGRTTSGRDELDLTPELVGELNQMSLLKSVLAGDKKQILLLKVAADLSFLKFLAIKKIGGRTLEPSDVFYVGEIPKPTLLYPTAEIAGLPTPVRDMIHNLYRYGNYITEMDGVLVELDAAKDNNVWGPTIDTVFSLWALRKHQLFNRNVRKAADIGTGTGMLAKAAVVFCPNLEALDITDIERNALNCAQRNINLVLRPDIYLAAIHAPGIRRIGQVDLLIGNPPYLPKRQPVENNPYEGTGLIREIIEHGLEHLTPDNPQAAIAMNYSSLAERDLQRYLSGRRDLLVERLESLTVPLKINWAQIDPDWMNYLLTECSLEVRDDLLFGYKFWHTLNVIKITRK